MSNKFEATFHGGGANPCLICGKRDGEKAMVFRMMPWCSERHRKIIEGEVEPIGYEIATMDNDVFGAIREKWGF